MTTRVKYSSEQLNELLNFKEQEWRCAIQEHVDILVKELAEKDELIALEKLRFHKLKEDFEYNLKLVEDRDKDLKKYEQLFEQMKGNDNLNNHQVSEMKIKIDEFQMKFNLLQKEKEEMQHHYQMRLKHYQEEMTNFYAKKEEEHKKEKDEYEELKRKLQRKIRDTEEELEFEKQKMLKELDENVRRAEQEFQIQLDKNETDIHAYELKVKMLSRELDTIQNSNMEVVENLETNKENATQFARLLKEKEWELQDMTSMKDLKIRELEGRLDEVQKSAKWKAEEFERKYCELEKLSNERESNLASLKTAADNSELKLREDLKLVHQQKEEIELNCKRLQWQISDMQVAKEKEVHTYFQKIEHLEKTLKEEVDIMNKTIVAKDLELEALKSSDDLLKKELNRQKSDVDRLNKELSLAMDRERILENAKVQLELDWRRRYETKETELYEKHEELIGKLTHEKEEAIHAKKQMEIELGRRENLIKLLEDDKAIAIKCLNDNGVNTDTMFADGIPERDIENIGTKDGPDDLLRQNRQLKEVIKEMRAEMELLSQQITSNTSTPNKMNEEKSNYVKDLEVELQNLKASNRNLMIKLEDLTKDDKPPLESDMKVKAKLSDPGIKSYIKELNETIGALRNDKVLITASLNSKDATINHLNETISKLTNEKQQQVVMIDNLKFDMSSKSKAFDQNMSSLKNRVSELELHLQQARSEAEIYYKSVMERNSDATQANNKLTELKLQQSAYANLPSHRVLVEDTKPSSFYKEKLKLAVERIKELAIERSQLINVGNKLRAELSKLRKENVRSVAYRNQEMTKSSNIREYGNQLQSKLEKLERMNYEATTDELRNEPKQNVDVNIKLMSSSSDISEIVDDRNNDDPPTKESAKENRPPTPLRSSSEHSSINEIWKMLENADDISSIPDRERSSELALVGKHIKPDERKTVSKSPTMKQKKIGKIKKRPVIRNYNQKDDV